MAGVPMWYYVVTYMEPHVHYTHSWEQCQAASATAGTVSGSAYCCGFSISGW